METKMGRAAQRYSGLKSGRDPYLQRARELASLTLPFLFPDNGQEGDTGGQRTGEEMEVGWTSAGAYCVGNLGSKVTETLFPIGQPPMKITPDRKEKAKLLATVGSDPTKAGDLLAAIEMGLSKVEQEWVAAFEEDGDRAKLGMGILKSMVGGQHGYQFYPDGTIRGISLERHVTQRDPQGNLIEFVICDPMSWESMDKDIQAGCIAAGYEPPEEPTSVGTPILVYTHGRLDDGKWEVYQEVWGFVVPGSRATYNPEVMPYFFSPWLLVDGEHYGRSYTEWYHADLQTLEGLTQTITEGSAAVARFLMLVHPGGLTSRKQIAEAPNGAVLSGRAEDVTTPDFGKRGDFTTGMSMADKAEQRLNQAFLVAQSIQRKGERVTAAEIRMMAAALEGLFGNVYSQQVISLQQPFVRLKLHYLQKKDRVTALPKGTTKVTIVAGLAAFGRNADLEALDDIFVGASQVFGPEALAKALPPSAIRVYLQRRAAARGFSDTMGLIPTAEEGAQWDQQAMAQQMAQQLGPEAVKQIGSNLTSNQVADTNAASKEAVAAMPPQAPTPAA